MATTTNYGWTTPDDTALVKDGAAAIRSLGTAIDTSFAADEGDLLVGGTSDIFEALPIGAVGTVLTSDGDTAEWAAPAGASESYSLINSGGTAMNGSSTVTVSSISGMSSLMFFVDSADANSSVQIRLRLNGDTGSNYFSNTVIFANPAAYSTDSLSSGTNSGTSINLLFTNNDLGRFIAVGGIVRGCNSTGIKSITFNGACDGAGSSAQIGTGRYEGTSTISSLSILASSGNFTGGTLYVYGSA
jgi:hypothetical protein